MHALKRRLRLTLIAVTAGFAMFAAAAPAFAAPNSPTPLATWGVWKSCGSTYPSENCAQVRGTAEDSSTKTLYAVGDFTKAINPADTSSLAYNDLVAINEGTGAVVSSFASHTFNGRIYAVAVDQSSHRVYVAGAFSQIDGSGTHAQHVAAFDAGTGKLLNFNARANGTVRALLLVNSTLYLGGTFTTVQGTTRGRLAAIDLATGLLSATFIPPKMTWLVTKTPSVLALALGADANGARSLYVGGQFDSVDGAAHMSLVRVNPGTGGLDTGFTPKLDVTSGDSLQDIDGLVWVDASHDGTPGIVAAQAGHTNRAYRFNTDGSRRWALLPDGDMQAVALSGKTLYFGGHFTCIATAQPSCGSGGGVTRVHIAAADLTTGALDTAFKPRMDPSKAPYFMGVWSVEVTANGTLWAGGVFKQVTVNGTTYSQPKLAAFPKA